MKLDISSRIRRKPKKLSIAKQSHVIELFHNLYCSGFHLSEIIDFLGRSQLVEPAFVEAMRTSLANGKSLSGILSDLGFSDQVTTQLALAELHGNVTLSLEKIRSYLENLTQVRKKLVEVATYPLLLLGFLVLIMLGLKNYLLPQLDSQNGATRFISVFPQYFLIGSFLFALIGCFLFIVGRRSRRLPLVSCLARIPFIRPFLQDYLTAYYAREWGNMIAQGLELSQVFPMMQAQRSQLFREIGRDLEMALANGRSFSEHIQTYSFFKNELTLMIEYGEAKSKLGSELEVFADKTWEGFFHRLNKAMNLVQPLVFIFVALMIVLLYAAMLLPIYENLEVHL